MSACKSLLVLVAALACLAGCAVGLDAGQARLCRAVIPALNGTASAIEVVRTLPLPAARGVRVDYRVQSATGQRGRVLECRCTGRSAGGVLAALDPEGGPVSD